MANGLLIDFSNPKSPAAEAYRTLRTNLQFLSAEKSIKTIAVTSASPGEGKSTTVANLAISIAQTGKRVLVVDCDLRKPQQHRIFSLPNKEGLSNVLVDAIDPNSVIKESGVRNLRLLTSGPIPQIPSELLGSKKMKDLIERVKAEYDLILFDTPPVMAVTDAAVVAASLEGVVLVIAAGMAKVDLVQKAKEQLANVKANILGAVINRQDVQGTGYYYYYYTEDGQRKKKKKQRS